MGRGCGAARPTAGLRSPLRSALFWLPAAAILIVGASAAAAPAASELRCIERSFASGDAELRLGRATRAGRTQLLGDAEGCPGPGAACRGGAFTVPGQLLLLGISRPGYVCAFAARPVPGSVGWIPLARLQPATDPVDSAPPLTLWLGTWRQGDDMIALSADGDQIAAGGEAYWPGKNIMPANEGAFGGSATPAGNRLRVSDNGCEVEMILAGPFLVVTDNGMCGGHNVSFSGVYFRESMAPRPSGTSG